MSPLNISARQYVEENVNELSSPDRVATASDEGASLIAQLLKSNISAEELVRIVIDLFLAAADTVSIVQSDILINNILTNYFSANSKNPLTTGVKCRRVYLTHTLADRELQSDYFLGNLAPLHFAEMVHVMCRLSP